MEKRFTRRIDALEDIFAFVAEFAARSGVTDSLAFKLNLAIEELFVNMVRHNPGNRNDVLINLVKAGDRLVVSMTDFDVEPFDITKADEYDSSQPLEQRPIGHLGIHLAKSMMDNVKYEYADRQSKITLIKELEKTDV